MKGEDLHDLRKIQVVLITTSPPDRPLPLPLSWWTIIFNPSFPYRLVHTLLAAYLTTAFAVGAVGAWHLLKDKANPSFLNFFHWQ